MATPSLPPPAFPELRTDYSQLEEGYFRVLDIRTVEGDVVTCHLETLPLNNPGPYDALSYVWGSQRRTETSIKIMREIQIDRPHVYDQAVQMYHHAWFNRLWVVREFVLAQRVVVALRCSTISWDVFYAFYQDFPHVRYQDPHSFPKVLELDIVRGYSTIPVNVALRLSRHKICTDKRDHILGCAGLLEPAQLQKLIDIGALDTIPSEPWTSFFPRFLKLLINASHCASEVAAATVYDILGSVWTANRNGEPPTWCPDWTQPSSASIIPDSVPFKLNAGLERTRDSRKKYINFWSFIPIPSSAFLRIRGFPVDMVGSTTIFPPTVSSPQVWQVLEWIGKCLNMCLGYDPAFPDMVPDAFWRTLVFDHFGADGIRHYHNYIRKMRVSFAGLSDEACESYDNELAGKYRDRLLISCKRRKFFSTSGGRVGMGPACIEPGDKVCIFYGAMHCFLVRFDQGENEPEMLLGEAYVHGLMHGEGLEGRPDPDESSIVLR